MQSRKSTKQNREDYNIQSLGLKIDCLIRSNLKNWEGKERYYNQKMPLEEANKEIIESFQANKMRNLMITQINKIIHKGPMFHFRNYHNY
jgi:hypothetical protein